MNDDEILKHSKNILKLIDIDTPNIGEFQLFISALRLKQKIFKTVLFKKRFKTNYARNKYLQL